MPTVLLFTTTFGFQARAFGEAARRAGVTLRVVSDRCDDLEAPWRDGAIRARFDRGPEEMPAVLGGLDGASPAGVLAVGNGPAWLAARVAQALGVPWHGPDAVAAATNALLSRGRWLAAGLPVPWFVSVPARGDEDLERLTRVRFPCVVSLASLSGGGGVHRVESLAALMAARDRLAAWLAGPGRRLGMSSDDETLIVEGFVPGQRFALDGVLEQGALRVFALFDRPDSPDGPSADASMYVTPARLAPARQHVIAGHIARAALALGLHHGPVHADCRVDDDAVVVLGVAPCPIGGLLARAVPVVAPDGTRCGLEDVLLAHALGHPLDRYGHEAVARGVVSLPVPASGTPASAFDADAVRAMKWVTDVQVTTGTETMSEGVADDRRGTAFVFAEAAQPDDVVAALCEATRQLRSGERPLPTSRA